MTEPWTPCIVRIAGLDASIIDTFRGSLGERASTVAELEAALATARSKAVDLLFRLVPAAAPDERRMLLRWKRDCFNGREIGDSWCPRDAPWLEAETADVLREVGVKEKALNAARQALETEYKAQQEREREQLVRLAVDPSLLRGISLASPSTATNLHRASQLRSGALDRKGRRLELSLLRFASRAALKLSPFSTLTVIGVGRIENRENANASVLWLIDSPHEHSLLRLKRYLFYQILEVLYTVPRFRSSLRLVLNNSLEPIGPERVRFYRRGFRGPDPETRGTRLHRPSMLRMDLEQRIAQALSKRCREEPVPFDDVVEALVPPTGSTEAADAMTKKLLRLGCLHVFPPWSNIDERAEIKMLEYLRSLPYDETLGQLILVWERLVALEGAFADSLDPVAVVEEIPDLVKRAWDRTVALADLDPGAKFVFSEKGDLYEDVVLENPSTTRGEVAIFPRRTLEGIMVDLDPLLVLGAFFDRRVDCLITLGALARREWPGARHVALLDLFSKARPLYQRYLSSEAEIASSREWTSTFDPLSLDTLCPVAVLRRELAEQLESCLGPSSNGVEIEPARLERLVSRVPAQYRPLIGGCLFIQPVSADGSLWVLNRLYEGTGRYSSRYTAVMGSEQRSRFADRLRAGCRFEIDGREAEIVDLLSSQGDTLNVHALQTERVLEFPGENSGASRDRILNLRDLSVELPEDSRIPLRLVDPSGRWVLPTHLGGTKLRLMPIMVKFLGLFGPGELRPVIPLPRYHRRGDIETRERVSLGKVVVLRKRWRIWPNSLVEALRGQSGARAFEILCRWRLEKSLPDRLFVLERRPTPLQTELYKPQFIDFDSPSFVKVFLNVVKVTPEPLVAEEMLPMTEDFSTDSRGSRRALEIQLESIVLKDSEFLESPAGDAMTPAGVVGELANRG